jgi:hypothetical protein
MKRNIIAGLLTLWLGNGFLAALAFGQAMPALNWKGQTYIGLTWPAALLCHEALNDRCSVVPPMRYAKYLFTFDD